MYYILHITYYIYICRNLTKDVAKFFLSPFPYE